MNTAEIVRERLVKLCAEKGWAYHRLARESAVHPSTMKGIINGTSQNPGVVTIKKLCDGLGISLSEFFNTEEFRSLEQEIR